MSSAPLASLGLRLAGVGKQFTTRGTARRALEAVDLVLAPGEIVAIVGASGCGKSTLLRIVAGLESDYEGEVWIGEQRARGPGLDRGMLFQEHRLLPWLTVAQNVAFGLTELPPAERERAVTEHIARVGLAGYAHAYPHELSGGMAQRAALARALAPNPGVLLLDEPFAALDALTKQKLQDELLRIHGVERPTLILVTHDVEEAVLFGDRVVVMANAPGRVSVVLSVELARPRERTGEDFGRLRRTVLRALSQPIAQPEEPHDSQAYRPAAAPARAPAAPRRVLGDREAGGDSSRLRHV